MLLFFVNFDNFLRISRLLPKNRKKEIGMVKIGLFLQKLFHNFHEKFCFDDRLTFAIIGRFLTFKFHFFGFFIS